MNLKIVVADDEKWIRKAIVNIIPFEKLGLELAGEADTGAEALALCQLIQPDILLTDIRMPEMTGLELAKEAKKILPEIRIIVISGYDDFEYARTAIKCGVSAYILKPIDEDELVSTIGDITWEIKNKQASKEKKQEVLPGSLSVESFFNQLLHTDHYTITQIEAALCQLEIQLEHALFTVVVLTMENALFNVETMDIYQTFVQSIQCCGRIISIYDSNASECILIVNHHSSMQLARLKKNMEEVIHRTATISGCNIYAGISTHTNRLNTLNRLYEEAFEALDSRFWGEDQKVFMYHSAMAEEEMISIPIREAEVEDIVNNIKIRYFEPAYAYTERLFDILVAKKNIRSKICKEFLCSYFYLLISRLDASFLMKNVHTDPQWSTIVKKVQSIKSLKELREYAHLLIEAIYNHYVQSEEYTRNSIEKTKEFIAHNFYKDISLEEAAQYAGLVPVYFSQLFKKRTGMTFTAYKIQVRMEHAKKLCRSPSMAVADISEAVGYTDPKHFSRLFKKITGVSISTYRNRLNNG